MNYQMFFAHQLKVLKFRTKKCSKIIFIKNLNSPLIHHFQSSSSWGGRVKIKVLCSGLSLSFQLERVFSWDRIRPEPADSFPVRLSVCPPHSRRKLQASKREKSSASRRIRRTVSYRAPGHCWYSPVKLRAICGVLRKSTISEKSQSNRKRGSNWGCQYKCSCRAIKLLLKNWKSQCSTKLIVWKPSTNNMDAFFKF